MPQISRPESDFADGGWLPTPIFERLDEEFADDDSLVSSPAGVDGAEFIVHLQDLAWPWNGPQRLKVRLKRTANPIGATIKLYQSDTLIAFKNVQPTASFVEYVLELTEEEKRAITNYTTLRASVLAGYPVSVDCCTSNLPDVLAGTVSNKSGQCVCLPDKIALKWGMPSGWSWHHPQEMCTTGCVGPNTNPIVLACGGSTCADMVLSCPVFVNPVSPLPGCCCTPLSLVFNCQTKPIGSPEIDGSFTLTVTE